jgi:hypothetical protein
MNDFHYIQLLSNDTMVDLKLHNPLICHEI